MMRRGGLMEEFWRETSELLLQRPILWLPVLLADLLGFLVTLGSGALLRSVVLAPLQYRSALGGAPMRAPISAAAMQHATLMAGLITWPSNFLRLLLYAAALIVTASLVGSFAKRRAQKPVEIGAALQRSFPGILSLTLRSFAIYAAAALLLDWVGKWLLAHGHKTAFANPWVEIGAGVLVVAALAWFIAPAAIQVLTERASTPLRKREAQIFAFGLGIVSLALGRFVATNVHAVRITSPLALYALELTGSWIAALPYVVLFVLLSRIAFKAAAEAEHPPERESA